MITGKKITRKKSSLTLEQARRQLFESLSDGKDCPCCGQYAKSYRRGVSGSQVKALMYLFQCGRGWHHHREFADGSGEHAKLRFWGLVEKQTEPDEAEEEDKTSTGYWRITKLGKRFVNGEVDIPKYVYIYNNQLMHKDNFVKVSVHDCIKNKFKFSEIMGGGVSVKL